MQYQIVLVNLDLSIGSEMNKTRPCVIISPNEMNNHLQTIVIAPITNNSKNYPTRIPIKHRTTKRWIVIDQPKTIDKKRVIKLFEQLSETEIATVKAVIKETYVD